MKSFSVLLAFCVCFLSISYLAIAASDSIQVKQTIGDEGTGIPPEEDEAGGGGIILPIDATPPEISGLKIYDIGLHSANISFQTDEPCTVEFYYGKAKMYDLGPLFDHADSFETSHGFSLDNLESGSKYYLKIIIKNQKGIENIVTDYSFYTIPEFKTIPAVGDLTATQVGEKVVLDWNNPQSSEFQGVQISRQIGTPPLSPDQGEKVFFGLADNFTDTRVSDDTRYYYTVFAFDAGGKFSSGVTVSIKTNFRKNAEIDAGTGNGQTAPNTPGGTLTPPDGAGTSAPGEIVAVKDVRNLQASADLEKGTITLDWKYAETDGSFAVEIRRDLNFPSMSPLEGELIYQGAGTSFVDSSIKKGQVYFYTVYVKNGTGKYSGGSMIAAELKESATASAESGPWKDMSFIDVNSGLSLTTGDGDEIYVLQNSTLGVSYGVEVLPENLVAVAIQIGNSSYLLNYDEEGLAYRTSFIVPSTPGEYSFDVVFLNDENEVFFEKDLKMRVLSQGGVYAFKKEKLFSGKISFSRVLCQLGNFLGGGNTDCMTRTVAGGAEVTIFRKNEDEIWEVWNAKEFKQENPFLTDDSGRYKFYVPDGEYEIGVRKDGFDYRKTSVTAANNILSEDVRIYVKKDIKYDIILLATLVILVAIKREKMISRHRKK